ncbi:hypothetical protein CCR95_07930 [Thiocystis minor]|uniref:pilus assembly protein n=1 Tax=Thiocystis minor TaxID=61597 RepID=UPI001914A5D2|nr:PilC/PilY family type IV pilus protein [Thiocystis minor]MBK5964017.1 hypothetical protein [Thiocystis minor]
MHRDDQRFTQRRPLFSLLLGIILSSPIALVNAEDLAQYPLFVSGANAAAPPLTMLIMGKDHTLYYEAYNDASDLSGDGVLDVGYKPNMEDAGGNQVDYYGYFDSHLCYEYSTSNSRFSPVSATITGTKKCSGYWSGDFLNYLTTSRIDALRKVLYGGKRYLDLPYDPDDDEDQVTTVLERSYIPQEAHSWGKEYRSIEHDKYNIGDYTPLSLPVPGTRHLFANTTLLKPASGVVGVNKEPLLRFLNDSKFRIWEWVAIERPVAGTKCINQSNNCATTATTEKASHPANAAAFQALITNWGTETQKCGSGPISKGNIDTSGSNNNPFAPSPDPLQCGTDEYYLTLIQGQINIPSDGDYQFATNGDDAVELLIDGQVVTGWYNNHATCGTTDFQTCADKTGSAVTKTLSAGWHNIEFHHEEMTSGDSWQLLWKPVGGSWAVVPALNLRKSAAESTVAPTITTYKLSRTVPVSSITDYIVRVQVCKDGLLDTNCKPYTDTAQDPDVVTYKPDGLLQQYGKNDQMYFGLMSGAFTHPYNMRGGVLRKNIDHFMNEVDPDLGEVNLTTGVFTSLLGIVGTIDRFRIIDFDKTSEYLYPIGLLVTKPMVDSTSACPDWGNPIGEMIYESLRYFSGKATYTKDFVPPLTDNKEVVTLRDVAGSDKTGTMELPAPAWKDPYKLDNNPSLYCAPGAQLVISDVNPSYDTDQIPGTFSSFVKAPSLTGDISGLDVIADADQIWKEEHGSASTHFIGQVGATYDNAPSAKEVSGLGNIRGLSPSEPTKQGGYYSAAIARFAFKHDLRTESGMKDTQDINTFSVALASPLPKIMIPVNNKKVTLVPFAKSVGGNSISVAKDKFQPTDTIVDFFIEEFANTDLTKKPDKNVNGGLPYVKFRINFEDVEQGNDHDMDAIVVYEAKVNPDNTLTVNLVSEYAAGSVIQHMGYVISGTTHDGVYLEVRDTDTKITKTVDDFVDTNGNGIQDLPGEPSLFNDKNSNGVKDADEGTITKTVPAPELDPDYFLDTPAELLPGQCDNPAPANVTACDEPLPLLATRIFTASANVAATVLENPLWYAAKYGSEGNEKLADGVSSPNYFLVTNAGKLQEQLEDAFTRIINLTKSSAASAAASSTRARGETLVYQAKFDPSDWSGSLSALSLFDDDETDDLVWDAELLLPKWNERQIYTWNATPDDDSDPAGIPFIWGEDATPSGEMLNTAQKAYLLNDPTILNWLRGDQSAESKDDGVTGWRVRTKILGDIVHSDPLYVTKPQNVGYARLPAGTPGKDTYAAFLTANAARTPMIYVGANDGMLHAFDATTVLATGGAEKFAYVPNAVFGKLKDLASPNYRGLTLHRDFVDGSPSVGDAYVNDAWRSILVGTLGTGGKAVFALDVTDPANFDADDVLWEFTDDHLGYMVGQMTSSPVIGRLQNGHWVAIFGNGYDSGTGAWLYIVDLEDGSLHQEIQVSDDVTNGLSAVALIRDSQQTIAGAYAGDLKGNLWKFDLTGSMTTAYSGTPLFQAMDDDDQPQPITGPLDVGAHPLGGYMVYFGTGQYMRASDVIDSSVQTVYGIWDNSILGKDADDPTTTVWKGGAAIATGRTPLLEQEIVNELALPNDPDNHTWRVISQHPMEWGTRSSPDHRGWFIDLISPVHGEEGERVVSRPQILSGNGQVLFTSIIPLESDDPCVVGGGDSWIFAVDLLTGGSSTGKTFDVTGEGTFDDKDTLTLVIRDGVTYILRIVNGVKKLVTLDAQGKEVVTDYTADEDDQLITVPASGMKMGQIVDAPRVLIDESGNYVPVAGGSSGEDAEALRKMAAGLLGRLGWRQLR